MIVLIEKTSTKRTLFPEQFLPSSNIFKGSTRSIASLAFLILLRALKTFAELTNFNQFGAGPENCAAL